ncbi:hypothetical protein Tco_1546615 [Tanacetum coccineum]
MVNGVMGQASLYTNGTTRLIDQILGGPTGKTDGAVVLSMVKMHHLVAKVGMSFDGDFWKKWHESEVNHGNEDTFRGMLRIKRSVSARHSQGSGTYNSVKV